ncbi:MAG: hypothetical protein ABF535_07060 [Acetobacter sp.]
MKHLSGFAVLCALVAACTDDRGVGAMHAAVSQCFARYPFQKGTAYDRFMCITDAHLKYGPGAVGARYDLVSQVDLASLRIGLDVDSGTLSLPDARAALNWVTAKAQSTAFRPSENATHVTITPPHGR